MDVKEFAGKHTEEFFNDIKKLNIRGSNVYPKVSENVEDMIELTQKLVDRGYAYEKLRSVYFDISRLDDYGALSNIDLTKVKRTRTVEQDDYEKGNPVDFALLKRSTLAELKRGIYFKTVWGNVRPSWHLECATIAMKYLADVFDIYIGGSDIVFPHCENVMAIGKAATGGKVANYWLNTELVMVDGKKMSRSLNNSFTVEDLEKRGYSGKEIRYFLLSSHYRKPLNFSCGALNTAANTVKKLDNFIQRLFRPVSGSGCSDADQYIYDVKKGFTEAMDDNFNISGALASVFDFVKKVNILLGEKRIGPKEQSDIIETMKKIDSVLGIMEFEERKISQKAVDLLEKRDKARAAGDWGQSDRIRDELAEMGILVFDTPEGTVWKSSR
jgi:cysteinyl-tRNA synthetase